MSIRNAFSAFRQALMEPSAQELYASEWLEAIPLIQAEIETLSRVDTIEAAREIQRWSRLLIRLQFERERLLKEKHHPDGDTPVYLNIRPSMHGRVKQMLTDAEKMNYQKDGGNEEACE